MPACARALSSVSASPPWHEAQPTASGACALPRPVTPRWQTRQPSGRPFAVGKRHRQRRGAPGVAAKIHADAQVARAARPVGLPGPVLAAHEPADRAQARVGDEQHRQRRLHPRRARRGDDAHANTRDQDRDQSEHDSDGPWRPVQDLLQAEEVPRSLHDRIESVVQSWRDDQRDGAGDEHDGEERRGPRPDAARVFDRRTATRRSSRSRRAARRRCRASPTRRRPAWRAPGPTSGICVVASVRIRSACWASASPRSRKPDSMTKAMSAQGEHQPQPRRRGAPAARCAPAGDPRRAAASGRSAPVPPSSAGCGRTRRPGLARSSARASRRRRRVKGTASATPETRREHETGRREVAQRPEPEGDHAGRDPA